MLKKTYRFALVGCGRAAQRHITAINSIRDAELAAVCDMDIARAEAAGKQHNVPYYGSYDDMLSKGDADIVCILTPSGLHAGHVIDIAQKFKKAIICEKPIALTPEDADRMIRTCEENDCPLFIVSQYRYKRPVQELKRAVDGGLLGRLFLGTVRVRWRRDRDYYKLSEWRGTRDLDGGVTLNQALHHIDLLLWLMGEPVSVMARTAVYGVNIEADNTALAIITFKSGALGLIEATTATAPQDLEGSISILGDRGSVVLGGFSADTIITWNTEGKAGQKGQLPAGPDEPGSENRMFIENVIKSLRDNNVPTTDGPESRKSLVLIQAIMESASSGREVYIESLLKSSRE